MRKILLPLSMLCLLSCKKNAEKPIQDFNGWALQSINKQAITISSDHGKCIKFDFKRSDWNPKILPNGLRVELSNKMRMQLNKGYEVTMRCFIPSNWSVDNNPDIIFQFHGVDGLGEEPLVCHTIPNTDSLSIWSPLAGNLWTAPIIKDQWINWRVQIMLGNNGFISVWLNDSLIINYNGATVNPDNYYAYFKCGIYKPVWGYRTEKVSERILYYDDITIREYVSN